MFVLLCISKVIAFQLNMLVSNMTPRNEDVNHFILFMPACGKELPIYIRKYCSCRESRPLDGTEFSPDVHFLVNRADGVGCRVAELVA